MRKFIAWLRRWFAPAKPRTLYDDIVEAYRNNPKAFLEELERQLQPQMRRWSVEGYRSQLVYPRFVGLDDPHEAQDGTSRLQYMDWISSYAICNRRSLRLPLDPLDTDTPVQ